MSGSRKALGEAIRRSETGRRMFPKTAAAGAYGEIRTRSGTVTYRITVTNNGPSDAAEVWLVDQLPAGLVLDPAQVQFGWDAVNAYPGANAYVYLDDIKADTSGPIGAYNRGAGGLRIPVVMAQMGQFNGGMVR
jgi:uncharacterized repeat protein (TIGR01451 family)